jgi:hypothetical protein
MIMGEIAGIKYTKDATGKKTLCTCELGYIRRKSVAGGRLLFLFLLL